MTQLLETASRIFGSNTVTAVEKDTVREHLSQRDMQKSMGWGGMHPGVLRELTVSLQDLHHIWKGIPSRELAGNWEKTNITVIFTKNKRVETGNCRLVSLTLILEDVMEQIQWKPFPNSCMTRPWSGTAIRNLPRANSLLVTHERASSANKETPEVVFLDFSKAPNPMCHSVIIGKLVRYGLDQRTTKWLEIWKDLWQLVF